MDVGTESYPGVREAPTIGDSIRRLTDGVGRLVREHLQLARAELKEDLRKVGRDVALILAGIPPLLLGYALLMVSLVPYPHITKRVLRGRAA